MNQRDEAVSRLSNVGAVLDCSQQYLAAFDTFLSEVRDNTVDGTVRLLALYLVKFKRHLNETLAQFSTSDLERIRTISLKAGKSEFDVGCCFNNRIVANTAPAGELLDHALELVEVLVALYDWIETQPVSPDARVLLQELTRRGEQGLGDLKKLKESGTL